MIVVSADSNSYETLIRANPPKKISLIFQVDEEEAKGEGKEEV